MHSTEEGRILLALARASIGQKLGINEPEPAIPSRFEEPGASFVTLQENGELRGCIGSLQAWRTLADDVCANALAAAFHDPRFYPVTEREWPDIRVEVSVLTAPESMAVTSEADLISQLRPDQDGVIVELGNHRATFLPQVWEQLPDAHNFLAHLKRKAGLSPDSWSPEMRWSRYQVQKWQENR